LLGSFCHWRVDWTHQFRFAGEPYPGKTNPFSPNSERHKLHRGEALITEALRLEETQFR